MFRKISILCALVALAPAVHADTYAIDAASSSLEVLTAKAGFFARAGHTHVIRATQLSGEVEADPKKPAAARLSLVVPAAGLKVQDPDMSEADRATVQKNMEGDRTLDVAKFPQIKYLSRSVQVSPAGSDFKVQIEGVLGLHGVNHPFPVTAVVTVGGERLVARGEAEIRQKDFGITPFKAVLGAVGVKNEVKVRFEIVALRKAAAPAR